jgi:germination protein M
MRPRLTPLLVVPFALAACGGSSETVTTAAAPPAAATTSAGAPTAPVATPVVAYFLREGKVAPARMPAPKTQAVAAAALNALFEPPPDPLDTAIPSGSRLLSLRIDAGVATATVSLELSDATIAAQAQIVYTLTQFPSVTGVVLRLENGPLPLSNDDGAELTEPATRADYERETPRILVESPLPGDTVHTPIRVTGTSNDFEATFQLELVQGGKRLTSETATATSGSGVRGTFAQELEYLGRGPATIVAFERNVGEGPEQLGRVEIPVVLE